jgi:hypothetical protein
MPFTRCPHCGRLQGVDRNLVGHVVGCMNYRCDLSFTAKEYRRNQGMASQVVFAGVIAFGVFLAVVWLTKNWAMLTKSFHW